ncbi:uncharacterized protein SPPG_02500 [Spizellomyces punctatus DAOM BR117]|uniref:Chromo domain-containing protein n=1 Tax=Spizellomyces punctatus (strain DAOM BR117) TaxID=645134 RepID=A0A0L0HME3_SPIPD|nr:uncharacterized protein SPPG_02500 [Spizellomyces punctatus DAOM BR117]KND01994.1 hypothetical protein SPPG_02500 [Spizellomyces punctatus DAOM BR117]|eukprot:XP_016610033.1 hypothetical protein SPPG_02500 [Spizellomyces punctatus DAOM BR117]
MSKQKDPEDSYSEEESAEEDSVAGSEGDEEESLYEVERIVKYRFHNGNHQYHVKWKNYPSSDNTWENVENLDNCRDTIAQFWQKTRQPRPNDTLSHTDVKSTPQDEGSETEKKSSVNEDETELWDDLVECIEAVEPATSALKMRVTVKWKEGVRSQHDASVIYSKCPHQALRFFAEHVDPPSE